MCLIIVGKHLTCIYLPHWKKLVTTWTINCKIFFGSIVFSRVWSSTGIGHWKAALIFIKDLLEDEQGLSMGGMMALLKYPFYPLFNFDNGMNLISKSLTILTSGQLLIVFMFAHIFWRYFIFAGFWPILEHEMARPTITRWHEEWRRPKPEQRIKGHDD